MKNKVRYYSLAAIFIALSTILGIFMRIPSGFGYFTLLDAGIVASSLLLGSRTGFWVGGVAAFLTDFLTGYGSYMFFSFAIHGGEGYLSNLTKSKIFNGAFSVALVVGGYFAADLLLYRSLAVATGNAFGNLVQAIVGYLLGLILFKSLQILKKDEK